MQAIEERDDPHVAMVGRLSPTPFREQGTVGTIAELEAAVRRTGAQGIVVDASLTFEEVEQLIHRCFELGINFMVLPRMLHQLEAMLELRNSEAGAMLQVRPEALRVPQLAVKRLMDVGLSSILLLLTAPLWATIAAAIKLDSRGPVLFSQTRAGVGGKPFKMHKFRTMVADADDAKKDLQHLNESGDPRLFKIKDDPRITRVGNFLRRYSLDEIPQLLNVLRGEMSLVGPRPFFTDDMADYEEHHFERLWVLPGITGLWQVSGRSDVVDFEEVVRLDREYIRNWSIWLDLSILIRTLPAAIGRDGAY
jgi:exopolysaccharide biosynthesis polyprenyl glycosylphosphotransferase